MRWLTRYLSLIVLLTFGLSACGGGGSAAPASPLPPPPVIDPPPPPIDPTSTAEWAALVTRLDIRFTTDRDNLIAEQAAAPGPLGGNYYRAARDRFTGYVDLFWDYAHDETIIWSNSSSTTFKQADVAVLLDDYRLQWLTFMDEFVDGLPLIDQIIKDAIRPVMISSINDGYQNTMSLLEAHLIQTNSAPSISKVEGTWSTDLNDLTITIRSNGQLLGYDYRGCKYEGVLIASRWLQSVFRIIIREDCGSDMALLSGTVVSAISEDYQALVLYASSATGVIDRDLSR